MTVRHNDNNENRDAPAYHPAHHKGEHLLVKRIIYILDGEKPAASNDGKAMTMKTASATASILFLSTLVIAGMMPRHSEAASFDCTKTDLKADEKAICDNRALNDLDVKMVTTFELISGLLPMGNRGELQDQQTTWLKTRQSCNANNDCIAKAYEARLKALMGVYEKIGRPL